MTTDTPTEPFAIRDGIATIEHLNIRKEGQDDAKEIAVDVKLGFAKLDRMDVLPCFDWRLLGFLWTDDPDGGLYVRQPKMGPLTFSNEVEGAFVTIHNMQFPGCKVKKLSLQPADGGLVHLTCSISLRPSAAQVAELAKLVQNGARITIEPPGDLFADKATGSDA